MSDVVLQWVAPTPEVEFVWVGPLTALDAVSRRPTTALTSFYVPPAITGVVEGEGIDVVGNEIRLAFADLPLAP